MSSIRTLAILSVTAISMATSSAFADDIAMRYVQMQRIQNFTAPGPMMRPVGPAESFVTSVINAPVRPTFLPSSNGSYVPGVMYQTGLK